MKYKLRLLTLLLLFSFLPLISYSQSKLKVNTVNAGGLKQTNSAYQNKSSIGLAVIGKSSSDAYQYRNGFWFISSPATFQLSVSVNDGWNLVSIPGLYPIDQNVTTWWSGKDPAASVFKFSNGSYQPVTFVAPVSGYWMKNLGANTYNTGDEWASTGIRAVTHVPIPGVAGWNLIGGYEKSIPTPAITTTPPGLIISKIYQFTGRYDTAATLEPGYGYWVNLSGDGIINLPDEFIVISKQTAPFIKKNWGKVIITDNSGKSFTLYAVNEKINSDLYELPPMPPEGIFDIRFGTGRIAEDLSNSTQSIEMSGVEYPINLKVEDIDIKLQDPTTKILNVHIKSGTEQVISNSAIDKLLVSSAIIPDKFSLEQNFPNPFNPSTKIRYSVPISSRINISIFNILGELVTVLVNEVQEAGRYEKLFNANHLSSGIYIYRMQGNNFSQIKKMILIK